MLHLPVDGTARSCTPVSAGAGGVAGSSANRKEADPNASEAAMAVERINPTYVSYLLIPPSCLVVRARRVWLVSYLAIPRDVPRGVICACLPLQLSSSWHSSLRKRKPSRSPHAPGAAGRVVKRELERVSRAEVEEAIHHAINQRLVEIGKTKWRAPESGRHAVSEFFKRAGVRVSSSELVRHPHGGVVIEGDERMSGRKGGILVGGIQQRPEFGCGREAPAEAAADLSSAAPTRCAIEVPPWVGANHSFPQERRLLIEDSRSSQHDLKARIPDDGGTRINYEVHRLRLTGAARYLHPDWHGARLALHVKDQGLGDENQPIRQYPATVTRHHLADGFPPDADRPKQMFVGRRWQSTDFDPHGGAGWPMGGS